MATDAFLSSYFPVSTVRNLPRVSISHFIRAASSLFDFSFLKKPPPLSHAPKPVYPMASLSLSLLSSLLLSLTFLSSLSSASPFSLEIHNRFSDRVRHWAESRGHPGVWWPQHGTAEYYSALTHHDRALHQRRSLATASPQELAFSDGNSTFCLSSLG